MAAKSQCASCILCGFSTRNKGNLYKHFLTQHPENVFQKVLEAMASLVYYCDPETDESMKMSNIIETESDGGVSESGMEEIQNIEKPFLTSRSLTCGDAESTTGPRVILKEKERILRKSCVRSVATASDFSSTPGPKMKGGEEEDFENVDVKPCITDILFSSNFYSAFESKIVSNHEEEDYASKQTDAGLAISSSSNVNPSEINVTASTEHFNVNDPLSWEISPVPEVLMENEHLHAISALTGDSQPTQINVSQTIKLRPRKPKPSKPPRLTKAERCKRYRAKIKEDPIVHQMFREKMKLKNRKYLAGLSEDQKSRKREQGRLRSQRYRERMKARQQQMSNSEEQSAKTPSKSPRPLTCEQYQKEIQRREKNKECQRRRRAKMSSQEKSREKKRRREYYLKQKGRKKK